MRSIVTTSQMGRTEMEGVFGNWKAKVGDCWKLLKEQVTVVGVFLAMMEDEVGVLESEIGPAAPILDHAVTEKPVAARRITRRAFGTVTPFAPRPQSHPSTRME